MQFNYSVLAAPWQSSQSDHALFRLRKTLFAVLLLHCCFFTLTISPFLSDTATAMASRRSLGILAQARSASNIYRTTSSERKPLPSSATYAFSTSCCRAATPSGPPPRGFRLPPTQRWDEGKETSLDKAGKYFLMTEMFRGMYVVIEQFFRPP